MDHVRFRPVPVQAHPYGGGEAVTAMAFITPPQRTIRPGLPPPDRYLKLLQTGAAEWPLDARLVLPAFQPFAHPLTPT
jgi:hypothetical protein